MKKKDERVLEVLEALEGLICAADELRAADSSLLYSTIRGGITLGRDVVWPAVSSRGRLDINTAVSGSKIFNLRTKRGRRELAEEIVSGGRVHQRVRRMKELESLLICFAKYPPIPLGLLFQLHQMETQKEGEQDAQDGAEGTAH